MMDVKLCMCGCGEEMLGRSSWSFKRGHKPKSAKEAKGSTNPRSSAAEAEVEAEDVVEVPLMVCELSEYQLDNAWKLLSVEQKAVAIVTALNE